MTKYTVISSLENRVSCIPSDIKANQTSHFYEYRLSTIIGCDTHVNYGAEHNNLTTVHGNNRIA